MPVPEKPQETDLPPLRLSLLRTGLRLVVLVALALLIHWFLGLVMDLTKSMPPGPGLAMQTAIVVFALAAYALLIAIPFVPGIEIGFALVMLRGAEIALPIYIATASGLVLAYLAGRFMPYGWLYRIFQDLRLRRAAALLARLEPLSAEARLDLLRQQWPGRFGDRALNYRYLLLAGLINLPGSGLIGGGGGICMLAGLSRLYRLRATVLTIVIAVLPFPLAVWFWGTGIAG
ncbi:MAG: hypothetical protein LJE68_09815 [Rhodobacter sp.]|nr:hypothetical protein [Rhodobacter sp.]